MRPRQIAPWAAAILLAAVLAVLLLPGPEPPEAPAVPASVLPLRGGPEGYVGSAQCRECHPREHASWRRSYHRTMTQVVDKDSVQADFDGVVLEHRGEPFRLSREDGYSVVIGKGPGAVRQPLTLVTGSHHMQVFWMPAGRGNLQVGFPFTWLIEDRRWVPRHDTFIRDPRSEPGFEFWNMNCLRCHVTGGIPGPDPDAGVFRTEAAELGISCEACHGPAAAHAELRRQGGDPLADPIVQPADLPPRASSQVCGQCHSMKWFDGSGGWEQHGFRYRPGDDLEETTPVIRAAGKAEQPWLAPALESNPGLLEDFFWPDGMIRVAGREYNGLLESACHLEGGMSCLSCHSMHRSDPDDQLRPSRRGNQACVQCHQGYQQDHSRHAPGSPGSLCYDCHMPHTSYGILKAIRSHEIDSPSVAVEKATGRPNACNLCHADRTLEWTAGHLARWFGHEIPPLEEQDRTIAAVPSALLSGDAAQRALAAWTLGWSRSRQASGDRWQAGLLARALDDPYAAVRYIAGRSLRRLPGFEEFSADFVAPPEERARAVQRALELWEESRADPPSGRPLEEEQILDLIRNRDDRPVRLRE